MTAPRIDRQPLAKPLVVFDGDCGFCRRWVRWGQKLTGDKVDYLPYQDGQISVRFPDIPRSAFEEAVHLITPQGRVCRGADAVWRTLALNPRHTWPLWAYEHIPGVAVLAEWAYRFIARHRSLFSALIRWIPFLP